MTPGISIEEAAPGPAPIRGVPTSVAGFIGTFRKGPTYRAIRVRSPAEFRRVFGGADRRSRTGDAVEHFFAHGGTTARIVRTLLASASSLLGPSRGRPTGLRLLGTARAGSINLLSMPAAAELPEADVVRVYAAALEWCRSRGAVLLIDPPPALHSPAACVAWLEQQAGALRDDHAAIYLPRLVADGFTAAPGSRITLPTSGAVAGVIARTDAARGVWKSPAGLETELIGLLPAWSIDDAAHEALNPRGLNAIRVMPSPGGSAAVLWGARTLVEDRVASEFRYLAVRRTTHFIAHSLRRSLQWTVLEANDEPLWSRVRASVEAFLMELFRGGAFVGPTPREAFFVRCDRTTMTDDDTRAGRAVVILGIAALRPGEFVTLRLELRAASG